MCLKNDSNLWLKIDTIKSVFFISIIMCWLAPFETLCQVQCEGEGGVWFSPTAVQDASYCKKCFP